MTLSLCVVFIAGPWQCQLQKRVQHDRTLTQQVDTGQMALLIQRGTVAHLYRRLTGGIGFKFYQDRKVPDQKKLFLIGNLTCLIKSIFELSSKYTHFFLVLRLYLILYYCIIEGFYDYVSTVIECTATVYCYR